MTLSVVQRQLLRYIAVGLASNLVCYLIYLGLTRVGMDPKLAMSILYAVGVLQTFFLNKRWTFEHGGARGPVFYRYCTAYALGYLFNLAVLYVLVDRHGYPHQAVQAVMIVVLAMMLFLAQKFWVFRTDDAARALPPQGL